MNNIMSLSADEILSENFILEIFDETNPLKRANMIVAVGRRAKQLGVKGDFEKMIAACDKVFKEIDEEENKKEKHQESSITRYIDIDCPYLEKEDGVTRPMECGQWFVTYDGIKTVNEENGRWTNLACYHPIIPIERLKNMETGEEQIKLAYFRNNIWQTIIVPKAITASASKIVALASQGISVTSETAKYLVRYLADIENLNDNLIDIQYSSSKLGWIKGDFLPYDKDIVFDGDMRFRQLSGAIRSEGNYSTWLNHVRSLRATNRIEIKMMLAASFASVLVEKVGALPFIVDLWGETEGGKTVVLMLACSVWANPAENAYIGDFKTTDVALEAKADLLNNLPMILDDTSRTSARIRENFEGIVYDLCSGKGKSRSNKELGINRENRWRNCFLSNGEKPLSSYVEQGGAINRILEVEGEPHIFANPHQTAETVKHNYGFAGAEFVQIVKGMDTKEIQKIHEEFQQKLSSDDSGNMQKQMASLAVILTADKIATDKIFMDGEYINIETAEKSLVQHDELSENERCLNWIYGKIEMNPQRFDSDTKCEKWGTKDEHHAFFIKPAFDMVCKDGGFNSTSFLKWAKKVGATKTNKNRTTLVKYNKDTKANDRIVCLLLDFDTSTKADEDGFTQVAKLEDKFGSVDIPFFN